MNGNGELQVFLRNVGAIEAQKKELRRLRREIVRVERELLGQPDIDLQKRLEELTREHKEALEAFWVVHKEFNKGPRPQARRRNVS
ncbi:MAG: hypothetical protein MRY49_01210 [Candidatus Pacebacteria bacterium]|nr:hypothetical protein [Candidatus Paceibacterota bacterium]